MLRTDSDAQRGFTLVEIVVALVASALLTVGLVRFSSDFNRSFNLQEQTADRDMNAHYAIKRVSEALMGAGANLPSKGWSSLTLPAGNPGAKVRVARNPAGTPQFLLAPLEKAWNIPVDDPKGFMKATAILAVSRIPGNPILKRSIDRAYSAGGFVRGIKSNGDETALARITEPLDMEIGDAIYAYVEDEYRLQGTDLMLNEMVLAENIDSLAITALTLKQNPTTDWSAMRSLKIKVSARTRGSDPAFQANGGYRSVSLSMDVLLRNRL